MGPSQEIPQIIHQSWKDENIPYHIYHKIWIESWALAHPDWEKKFWTDQDNERLVRDHYPEFYNFFMGLSPGIKKAGFCRYLYMHRYGGVYVDMDFICLKNLSPLLTDHAIVLGRLSQDNDHYHIPDAFMASSPGNDFWMKAARDAHNAQPAEQTIEAHTGPFRLQWSYYRYQPENSIVRDQELIYPLDWIHFVNWNNGKYFREDQVRLAQEIRGKSVEEISRMFPRSYCVTVWTHNWGE